MLSYKVTFLGDTNVGKTSIINFRENHAFQENVKPSVSMSYTKTYVKKQSVTYELNLVDTAGQETFDSLAPLTIRGSTVILLIFDLDKPETLSKLTKYYGISRELDQDFIYLVIGNKKDLVGAPFPPFTNARNFAKQISAPFLCTSAKTGENIDMIFEKIAEILSSRQKEPENSNIVDITKPSQKSNGSSCC